MPEDGEARLLAQAAREALERHEARCQEQYRHLERVIERIADHIEGRIDALAGRWLAVGAAVITALVGALGYMIVHGAPWGGPGL